MLRSRTLSTQILGCASGTRSSPGERKNTTWVGTIVPIGVGLSCLTESGHPQLAHLDLFAQPTSRWVSLTSGLAGRYCLLVFSQRRPFGLHQKL
jgi:hypothetical protein